MPTKFMGIRLPEDCIDKLEKISIQTNQSANQLAKNAIIEWVEIHYNTKNMDMITIPKSFYADLLLTLNDDQIKTFADQISNRVISYFEYLENQSIEYQSLDSFLNSMVKFIGHPGLMWFDHLEYETKNKPYYLKGLHNIGKKWSEFFYQTFTAILEKKDFNFKCIKDKTLVSDSMIYLEFEE